MTNKDKFLQLVSECDDSTIKQIKNRAMNTKEKLSKKRIESAVFAHVWDNDSTDTHVRVIVDYIDGEGCIAIGEKVINNYMEGELIINPFVAWDNFRIIDKSDTLYSNWKEIFNRGCVKD